MARTAAKAPSMQTLISSFVPWRLCLPIFCCLHSLHAFAQGPISFDRQVAPILAARCLSCHGVNGKAKLDLRAKRTALAGGESGIAIVPGKVGKSLLWQRVAADEMPPKHPLSAAEKKVLRDWIEQGARWGSDPIDPFRFSTASRAGYDWWSLQPLKQVPVPETKSGWARNPIDHFVLHRLSKQDLSPSPRADARTLVRRLYVDLLGLPAPPQVIDRFARDPSQAKWKQLVDRLLDSPHYGERWARHWLDVARFGESHGFEYNVPRDSAYHYRDWVIRSLNRDLPYNQFARLQIAGDILQPDSIEGAAAVGFLVAGIHNTVLGRSAAMKLAARHEELAEMAGIIGQTFLGLTLHCARCHDHKFDPVSTREYYQFIAAISGVHHGERKLPRAVKTERLKGKERQLAALHERLFASLMARGGFKTAANQVKLRRLVAANQRGVRYQVSLMIAPSVWADGGQRTRPGDGIEVRIVRQDGSTLLARKMVAPRWNATKAQVRFEPRQFSYIGDGNGAVRVHLRPYPLGSRRFGGAVDDLKISADDKVLLRESFDDIQQKRKPGRQFQTGLRVFFGGKSTTWVDWGTNSIHSVERAKGNFALQLFAANDDLRLLLKTKEERQLYQELKTLQKQISGSRPTIDVYTVQSRNPGVMRVMLRGDITNPAEAVAANGLRAVRGLSTSFQLGKSATDAERRLKLAHWITGSRNGPFHRVIVNRVWHYHFGQGIVRTPNDFGFNGGRPSHPQLLEWLAVWFRDKKYSLKKLHRLIVTSATWQQSSRKQMNGRLRRAVAVDQGNRLLWRQNARRVDAETLRDSMLDVAGVLNRRRFGIGFLDTKIVRVGSAHYYIAMDPVGSEFRRRTIYRWQIRGQRSSLLESFDCPDPSTTAPARGTTTTAAQALSQWNHSLVQRLARHLAKRAQRESPQSIKRQVNRMWKLTLGRLPDKSELAGSVTLARKHGLPLLGRVLFNSNEWIWVE